MASQAKSYKKFMATAAAAAIVATAVAPAAMAASFTDVSSKYEEAVNFVVSKGASGMSEKEFGVHENIKRVDAAVLLVNVLGLDIENAKSSGFTDVPKRAVKHVNALKEAGITSGKTATTFDSHSLITRGELAMWIQKGFDLIGENGVSFTDVPSKYAKAVAALVDNGVTSGVSKTQFGTYQQAKRGDFAIFLMKASEASTKVEYAVKSTEIELTSSNENVLNTVFNGTVLDFGSTAVTVTDVDFASDNEALIKDNDAVKEGTVAIAKYSGQTSIHVDTVTVKVNDTNKTRVLDLNDMQVDVKVVGESDSLNYQVDSGATLALEEILGDTLNNISSDINYININVPANATVTWETGASHGSTPLIPEGSSVKTVTLSGGTFKATGDGIGPVRAANEGGKLVFKNMTIIDESVSYAENSWEHGYLEFGGEVEFVNSKFENAAMFIGEKVSFTGCTFNSNKDNEYAVWIDNGMASFDNCTFEGARGLKIHEAYGSDVTSVTVDNSKFGPLSKKPGVAIGDLDATTEITIKNSTFEKTQAGDQSNYIYESDTPVTQFIFTEVNNTVIK